MQLTRNQPASKHGSSLLSQLRLRLCLRLRFHRRRQHSLWASLASTRS